MRADVRQWSVQIFIGEIDGGTFAEAALSDESGHRARGTGRAEGRPTEPGAVQTPVEVAVARALEDLSRGLLAAVPLGAATEAAELVPAKP